jgi:sulfur carrier protein
VKLRIGQPRKDKDTGNMAIEITVNGEARAVEEETTLLMLLETLGLDQKVVAAQVNDAIVPRDSHATVALQAGDTVEIVRFVGGG